MGTGNEDDWIAPQMTPPAPRIESSDESPSRGFVARLQGASLGDLIQMECLRGARHIICVSSGVKVGYLFFDQGNVVHASSGRAYGEEAVFEMMSWKDGTFVSVERPWPLRPTIHTGWQMLLIEAMRRSDESRRENVPDSGETIASKHLVKESTRSPGMRSAAPPRPSRAPSEQKVEAKRMEDGLGASENDAGRYGLLRAVRIDEEGQTVSTLGDVGDLSDVAAYAARLARLIGQGLGLDEFVGLECKAPDRTMLVFPDGDTVVALEADSASNIDGYKKRAGF